MRGQTEQTPSWHLLVEGPTHTESVAMFTPQLSSAPYKVKVTAADIKKHGSQEAAGLFAALGSY